jgi:hypothetical protein
MQARRYLALRNRAQEYIMKRSDILRKMATMLCACAVLSACGSSKDNKDDGSPLTTSPTVRVPDSASASISGLFSYLSALVGVADETSEPLDLTSVTPPTDDGIEPSVIG